ncbi:MAG TPA: hypothetical protein VHB21_14090, partial [Minicystis sp.]|nr:hypothetical protein [Minicystis sp.]
MTHGRRAGRAARAAFVALLAPALAACGNGRVDPRRLGVPTATSAAAARPDPPPSRVVLSFVSALPSCDVDHRGQVLDAGSAELATRYGWSGAVPPGVADVEHDGSTWSRVAERRVDFVVDVPDRTPIFVAARAQGHGAKSAQVAIDDQPLGTLSLPREQIRIASTGATTLPVDPGLHTVSIRFFGRARGDAAFADLDWIRVGVPGPDEPAPSSKARTPAGADEHHETYGAPTLQNLVAPAAAIGGVPHRALALHAPGAVRCMLRLPKAAHVRAADGLTGAGAGDAENRV